MLQNCFHYAEFDHEGEGGLIPNSFSGSLSNEIEDKENKQAGFDASCEDDGEKACKAAKKSEFGFQKFASDKYVHNNQLFMFTASHLIVLRWCSKKCL